MPSRPVILPHVRLRGMAGSARLIGTAAYEARVPYLPSGVLARIQASRVQRAVANAYRTVPYYRDTIKKLGLTPDDFRTASDLEKLPVIERSAVQRDPEYFTARTKPIHRHLKVRTSGTTGEPLTVFADDRTVRLGAAHLERFRAVVRRLTGKHLRYREAVIYPPGSNHQLVHQRVSRTAAVSGFRTPRFDLSLWDPPAENLPRLNELKPDVISSFGSYLTALFSHVRRTGAPFHCPRVVSYGGDDLSPGARELISSFGVTLLAVYRGRRHSSSASSASSSEGCT